MNLTQPTAVSKLVRQSYKKPQKMMPMIVVLVHHAEELEHEDVRGALSSIQESSSLFLMGLKEEHKLTQVALQGMIEGVTNLTQTRLSTLQHCMLEFVVYCVQLA